jgi:hypothetical protein
MITAFALALTLLAADGDQDALNAARDLYASAAYEDALAVLNRVSDASRPPTRRVRCRSIAPLPARARENCRSRARHRDDDHRATRRISRRPATCRRGFALAFGEVRQRIAPGIIQQRCAQAKSAYDRKEFDIAAAGFGHALEVMKDPELAAPARPAAARSPTWDARGRVPRPVGQRGHAAAAARGSRPSAGSGARGAGGGAAAAHLRLG